MAKITKYRKPININIGVIIFALIFFEILIALVSFMNKEHVVPYEVKEGSLSTNNIYRAIALREEIVCTGTDAGYINYYIREGAHAAVGDLVYTVDESGKLSELNASQEESSLSEEDLSRLRADMSNYIASFSTEDFGSIYSFKSSIQSKVAELANYQMLANVNSIDQMNSNLVHYNFAGTSGSVVYHTDGYENLSLENMNSTYFDETAYEEKYIANNELVNSGDIIYKLCTDEDWSVVIQTDKETADFLMEKEYVEVRFLKNQYTSWGKVSTYTNMDGETFVELTFTNSMITFCTERFLNIELLLENESGLKIPNSSIAERVFFVVPKDYVTKGGNKGKEGVLRETYDEEGNLTTEFVETSIYSETEDSYYLDDTSLRQNDYIIKPESTDKIQVRNTDTLTGVYNINKGYAEFREIQVKYQNEDYSIVEPNTTYGLNVYDYIILDASTVKDNDFIY